MTLGGVVNHVRWVEHSWIEHRFVGGPDLGPWTDDSPDQEFLDGAALPIQRVLDDYRAQAARTDNIVASYGLDDRSVTACNRENTRPCARCCYTSSRKTPATTGT